MKQKLKIYNTFSKKIDLFEPIHPPFVGMYVCGPTVYGDAHLGHARPAIVFDLLFRYLLHLGYKVRYVRNITDVGHLENDADEGEDKIAKKARLEQLEPMEVAQHYTNRYRYFLNKLNVRTPSIEPHASGHIIEQISIISKILSEGYAYEVNGSVYFDVAKYSKSHEYGKLSGRKLGEMLNNTRSLDGQDEKRSPSDFALWKKANPVHIMRWPSPWSEGFPGWHIECSAMSTKYLGEQFDIHGGGMDLLFPHHESEIAQSTISNGRESVKYWVHNNLITINGQKMGKSLGNFISLDEFFSGNNEVLNRAYNPMTIRFFILQAHYRSTLDFSNEALQAAEKGLQKVYAGIKTLKTLTPSITSSFDLVKIKQECYEALNEDLNSPVLIAKLFEIVRIINLVKHKQGTIKEEDIELMHEIFDTFFFDILGMLPEELTNNDSMFHSLVELVLELRRVARENKDFTTSDLIRNSLNQIGIKVKDGKDGISWEIE